MAKSRRRKSCRHRVGKVSYYQHHGGWWVYYQENGRKVRERVADDAQTAAQIAAQINAQLASAAPTLFSFTPIVIADLQRRFIDHHEHVLRSSLGTVRRYRTATRHLVVFSQLGGLSMLAHELDADGFVRHLRSLRVAPNGHANCRRRPLRDKGVRYVLECCRSMYGYAAKKRHLPPYSENPFSGLGGKRFRIEDAKRIFVFDRQAEINFLKAADDWSFPVFFMLAKTGIRPGELSRLLIEDFDLNAGWMDVRNKPELGWRIKTGAERTVPLTEELVLVLRRVIGDRTAGPVFLRQRFLLGESKLGNADYASLCQAAERRTDVAEAEKDKSLSREQAAAILRGVWRDAGAVRRDAIRTSFMRITRDLGMPHVTCPKSWRHSFATLLQDANVDPLIRQIVLGHSPSTFGVGALGMTSHYTHPRPETIKGEVDRALRLWPDVLQVARQWSQGGDLC